MTSAVDKMKERSRQWAAQLPRIHGTNYTAAWIDGVVPSNAKIRVNSRGSIIIDVSMVYLNGAFVLLQVKHTYATAGGRAKITWTKEYIKVPRPHNKKERGELLRNMATMHAMKLGYPHKLRSKV